MNFCDWWVNSLMSETLKHIYTHQFWDKTSTIYEPDKYCQTIHSLSACSSSLCEMCGNSSLQPQQLSVMPARVSGPVIFHRRGRGEDVWVCVKSTPGKEGDLKPHLSTNLPPPTPLHPPPFHPTFFPSLLHSLWEERWICVWGEWCHFWRTILSWKGVKWRKYFTLFRLHVDSDTCYLMEENVQRVIKTLKQVFYYRVHSPCVL